MTYRQIEERISTEEFIAIYRIGKMMRDPEVRDHLRNSITSMKNKIKAKHKELKEGDSV